MSYIKQQSFNIVHKKWKYITVLCELNCLHTDIFETNCYSFRKKRYCKKIKILHYIIKTYFTRSEKIFWNWKEVSSTQELKTKFEIKTKTLGLAVGENRRILQWNKEKELKKHLLICQKRQEEVNELKYHIQS